MYDIINELAQICGKNDYEFTLKASENINLVNIDHFSKTVLIEYYDPKDVEFHLELETLVESLKQRFN
jgi:hypothetical protein